MNLEQVLEKFKANPKYLSNGAGFLGLKWNTNPEIIKQAKKILRKNSSCSDDSEETSSVLHVNVSSGETMKEISCKEKPKNLEEIKALFHVDDVSTTISQYWIKERKNGFYISALIKSLISNFYSEEELKNKIKDLFKETEIKPVELKAVKSPLNKCSLVVYLSDDHVGMITNDSMYKTSKKSYKERLMDLYDYIGISSIVYDELVIVSLGDQMNGWNEETTRGGHKVESLSNKEQFDLYVEARREFYDKLFTSGISSKYRIVEINNSNHSGLGFSYMANKCLQMYLNIKYPSVEFINSTDFATIVNLKSGHKLIAVHGKDEKYQKNSFPLNLDSKTETWFMDFMLEHDINPKKEKVTVVKGDLHRYNVNEGKSFRYLNVPSIANGSEWQEKNFGSSKPGVIVEFFMSEQDPSTHVIRF